MSTATPVEIESAVIAAVSATALPAIGAAFEGGFYTGVIQIEGKQYALITAGAAGQLRGRLLPSLAKVDGADHRADGQANTETLAGAGSELAQAALALSINGFSDWYIPARDEQELQYRAFKPTAEANYADGEDGVNPSSVPVGEAYTEELPEQTVVAGFKEGEPDAFEDWGYWSSTQHASDPSYAWDQIFDDGYQGCGHKDYEGRVRVVRRLPIQ
ncbi:DUF1566 domain-containing protein [Duganella sp. CY15W]|uniref:Lcl domain-containing protein n=1 Tax=Duganella sp. CY15W TaxID=2692172 RepID=UPI00136B6D01|nr:DUF1566 domain-containing protein [Duganella sp. CY15W]MYM31513.1 DUF1566 domain-containing protein [Duganella sp. CY15W]